MINKLSAELVRGNEHLIYWKHKGLFELEQLSEALQVKSFSWLSQIFKKYTSRNCICKKRPLHDDVGSKYV